MFESYSFYLEEEDGIYRYIFSTQSNIKYAVYFTYASEYFGSTELPPMLKMSAFNFGITRIGVMDDLKVAIDVRIKYTVRDIIIDFYGAVSNPILLLNYDDFDGKEQKRFNCFSRWFKSLNRDDFYKEDAEIVLPDASIMISLILENKNKQLKEVIQEFHDTRNKLIEEK